MSSKQIALLLIVLHLGQFAFAQQSAIDMVMAENQPEGFGPGILLAQAKGTLSGNVNSTVVLFTYSVGNPPVRGPVQYLAAFDNENGSNLIAGPIAVGSVRAQLFTEISIEGNRIRLKGSRWEREYDASPLNTKKIEQYLILSNGHLIVQAI